MIKIFTVWPHLGRHTHKEQQIGSTGEWRQQLQVAYAEYQQKRNYEKAHVQAHIPLDQILIHELLNALRYEDHIDAADAKVIEGQKAIHKWPEKANIEVKYSTWDVQTYAAIGARQRRQGGPCCRPSFMASEKLT